MQWYRLSRRGLLEGSAALGLAALLPPRLGPAQDASVLRVRSYSDLQVLDPAHRKAQPEGDIMRAIYTKLIDYAPGDVWQWRPTGAASIAAAGHHVHRRLRRDDRRGRQVQLRAHPARMRLEGNKGHDRETNTTTIRLSRQP